MDALWNRAFFLTKSQPSQMGCLPYFHTCSPPIEDAKNRQNLPCVHQRTILSGYIFATKARIDNRKKAC